MRAVSLLALALIAAHALAGCIEPAAPGAGVRPQSADLSGFDTSRGWSVPLSPALYEVLEPVETMVESFDGTPLAVAVFLPDVPGCDFAAASVPEECRVPVVMDAGPYYGADVSEMDYRPPLIEWLVPRGYAVAHMAIRGTSESGGCMELFSMNEQKDVDHVVTWLAERPWSTGNVGMMGRSYDGTTPLMAAALGNPHLKTIVPISGVPSLRDLMFKNGTSEGRGPTFHSIVYWANYGLGLADDGTLTHRRDHLGDQACTAAADGAVQGPLASLTGDVSDAYWEERDFRERVLENYNGSIWIIHGLEDWNVNPSQVVPWFQELQDAGTDVKLWLGVWGHAYPDRVDEHRNVRWDWAEWTVRWFDRHLKGLDVDTGPVVEVEDRLYVWRAEESYPPRDLRWEEAALPEALPVAVARGVPVGLTTEPYESSVRIAGLPRFHATVTPTASAPPHVFAELYDVFPDGRSVRIGWAAMNLAYHAGGNTEPATLVPGQPVVALMEFEPMDALVAEGHRLRVLFHLDGVQDVMASRSPTPVVLDWGESTLLLPVVDRPNLLPSYAPPRVGGEAS